MRSRDTVEVVTCTMHGSTIVVGIFSTSAKANTAADKFKRLYPAATNFEYHVDGEVDVCMWENGGL